MIHKRLVSLNSAFPWALAAVIGQMAQSFVIGLPHTAIGDIMQMCYFVT